MLTMSIQHISFFRYLPVLLGMLVMSSCSKDFLDVIPTDRIPKDAFFRTEQDFITAVNGIYAQQRTLYSSGEMAFYNLFETRSDNTHQKFGRQTEHRAVDNFTAQSGNNTYIFFWQDAYNCINLANAVIDRAAEVDFNPAMKARLVGEAKFIRGHTYFLLVQAFGGVPMRLSETISLSGDNNLARSSRQDVYAQIISDLEAAAAALPESYTGSDVGRATSGAAYAMLGKVHLQNGNPAAAVTVLRQVVKPGSRYSLLDNYADLWIPTNGNNAESIFEIQYHPPFTGSPYHNHFAPPSLNLPGGNNGNTSPNTPTEDLINSYEPNDERRDASIAYDGTGRPYIIKFRDPAISVGNDANNNFPVMRYADAMLLLAEALGEGSEAYQLINAVRARAGLDPIDENTPGSFRDKLLQERRVELAFEAHRWNDMLRMMTPNEVISKMNTHLEEEFPGQNLTIDANDLLNPFPSTEIQTNTALEQNPGYI